MYKNEETATELLQENVALKHRIETLQSMVEEKDQQIEDLEAELEQLKRDYKDLEQDLEDNYKPIDKYELYGVSERDFYE